MDPRATASSNSYYYPTQGAERQQSGVDGLAAQMGSMAMSAPARPSARSKRVYAYSAQAQVGGAESVEGTYAAPPAPLSMVAAPAPATETRAKIDPSQVPSPVTMQEQDQELYAQQPFLTNARTNPPLASTDFRAVDLGNCNPKFMRMTMYSVPQTEELLNTSKLPLGAVIQPLAILRSDEAPIEIVDFGEHGPIRCDRCKSYINPFVKFIESGRKYICNLCMNENTVPDFYFSSLNINGQRLDVEERKELRHGSVEFVATGEYIKRKPEVITYFFGIDVSPRMVSNGILHQIVAALKLVFFHPNRNRVFEFCNVVLFAYDDKSAYYFNLSSDMEEPAMIVLSDLDDVFLPLCKGFAVNLVESRAMVEKLLDSLPVLFGVGVADGTAASPGSALLAAVKVACNAVQTIGGGGKLILFHNNLPMSGPGALKNREIASANAAIAGEGAAVGIDNDKQLFAPQDNLYTQAAVECVECALSVDLFLSSTPAAPAARQLYGRHAHQYIDIATIGVLASITGGEIHYFPGFDLQKDGIRYANQICKTLARDHVYDAVMRVRCSNGIRVVDYFGNFHMKNSTDLEIAGLDCTKAIGVVLKHQAKLACDNGSEVAIQCALLYTSADGGRRIRVHNLSVPITTLVGNMFRCADMDVAVNLIAKQAVTSCLTTPLRTIRKQTIERCVQILSAYRRNCASSTASGQLILPEAFKLFPLTVLAMLKSEFLRINAGNVSSDLRVAFMRAIKSMSVSQSIPLFYPRIIPLHCLVDEQALQQRVTRLPVCVRAGYEQLDPTGVFLIEDGQKMILWLGRQLAPEFLVRVTGYDSLESIDPAALRILPQLDNPVSQRVRDVVAVVEAQRDHYLGLHVIRQQTDTEERELAQMLVEDKSSDDMSYIDFLCFIHRQVQHEIATSH